MECHNKVTLSDNKNMRQYATAVSNHSQLKWREGSPSQNKNREPNSIIMRRNCLIYVLPSSLVFSLLEASLRSPQHSSEFLPRSHSLLGGKVKRFLIYLRLKTEHKTWLPRETHEETANTLPQISDLGGAENSMRIFVCRDKDLPHSPDAVLSLNILQLCVRNIKIHFDFYWKRKDVPRTKDNCIDLLSS